MSKGKHHEATETHAEPRTPAPVVIDDEATIGVHYAGPHARIVMRNVPEIGDVTFVRKKRIELPAKAARDLIKRRKVVRS